MFGTGRFEWEEFFVLYGPLAQRIAAGRVGTARAEEIAQEAARVILQTRSGEGGPFESREHARNSYLRIVRNLCTDDLRRVGRRPAHEEALEVRDPGATPLDALASAEARRRLRGRVRDLLSGLSPAEREVLELRFGQGLGFREIAERTGTAISTLHARVEAGLAKIRDRLGKDDAGT